MASSDITAPQTPKFKFIHAGSNKPLAWPKYKLKECWALVLCFLQLRGQEGAVVVHNWYSNDTLKFTHEFHGRRAAKVAPKLEEATIIEAHAIAKTLRFLAIGLATLLALFPVATIIAITRMLLPPKIKTLVIFCDGHLSGFALVLAARAQGAETLTLHHGLYRSDDKGSIMGILNFVADRICLWDGSTRQAFLDAGVAQDRLLQVGEYGFGKLSSEAAQKANLALLCPPYNLRLLGIFKHLSSVLSEDIQTVWSLHPMLRADHKDLSQVTVATVAPRPSVVICGDSGALMDALARNIPVITIADRPLAVAHLTLNEAKTVDRTTLDGLWGLAQRSLKEDRLMFGFEPDPNATNGTMS
jgi:hypothetical protein